MGLKTFDVGSNRSARTGKQCLQMLSDGETLYCKASVFRAHKRRVNKVEGEWVWTFRLKFKFTFLVKSWEKEDARAEERRACDIFH